MQPYRNTDEPPDAVAARRAKHNYVVLSWTGFGAILLHNLEEALTAPGWLAKHRHDLETRFGFKSIPAADREMLYINLTVLTLLILLWVPAASRASKKSFGVSSLAFLFSIFFCNAIVPHVAGAVMLRSYVPGALTATILIIPFTIYWAIGLLRTQWITIRALAVAAVAAVGVYVLVLGFLLGTR